MRGTAACRAIAALAVFLALPAFSLAADVDALVAKAVEAYGGPESLRNAAVIRQTGKVVSLMRGGAAGSLTRIYRRPGMLRVEIAYPDHGTEVRVLSGAKGWRQGIAVTGPPYDAMVLQAARIALPLNLLEGRKTLKDLGEVERGGKRLRALGLPLAGGLILTVEIDPDSGRILRSGGGGGTNTEGMAPVEFVTTYGDFRKVAGRWFAFHEGNYAMGRHTGDTTLETVEILDEPPPGTFLP